MDALVSLSLTHLKHRQRSPERFYDLPLHRLRPRVLGSQRSPLELQGRIELLTPAALPNAEQHRRWLLDSEPR